MKVFGPFGDGVVGWYAFFLGIAMLVYGADRVLWLLSILIGVLFLLIDAMEIERGMRKIRQEIEQKNREMDKKLEKKQEIEWEYLDQIFEGGNRGW